MNLQDYLSSLNLRTSLDALKAKHPTHLSDAQSAYGELKDSIAAIKQAGGEHAEVLGQLDKDLLNARGRLGSVATLEKTGWIAKEGVDTKLFDEAKKSFTETSKKYESFLSGSEKVKVASGAEVAVPEQLKASYTKATEAVGKVKQAMDGMFSMAKLEGAGVAAKHNFSKINPLAKERVAAGGKELAMRGGSVVVGAAMTVDALMRGTKKDGERRSTGGRFVEALAGGGLVAGGLLAGHAR